MNREQSIVDSLIAGGESIVAPREGVQLIRASELRPQPINWLWREWLARGKLHIIAGAPGCGKTTIAMALASTVTSGGRWPDGSQTTAGNVIVWSGEDGPRDTLLPRLLAMGANAHRVYFVSDFRANDSDRPFDPAVDMPDLEREAKRIGDVALVIIDPIVNVVAGDSHKNTETRRALQPVVDFGERLGAAIVGVSHYTKGTAGRDPVERVTGSVAFGALPRLIFGAAKSTDEEGNTNRIFVRAKSNIGPDGGGYSYELQQHELSDHPGVVTSRLLWNGSLEGQARALLAAAELSDDDGERSAQTEAEDFLRSELAHGRQLSKDIDKAARAAGIADRTLRRARHALGIKSRKDSFTGGWYLALPEGGQTEVGQLSSPQKDGRLGHLGQDQAHTPRLNGHSIEGGHVGEVGPLGAASTADRLA